MSTGKHIPMRTCVACRTAGDKRGLLRVVRELAGQAVYDKSGKMNGRGAYICASEVCIQLAKKQRKLERSLKCDISDELITGLLQEAVSIIDH